MTTYDLTGAPATATLPGPRPPLDDLGRGDGFDALRATVSGRVVTPRDAD